MTTIAYKGGVIAADRQLTGDDTISFTEEKLVKYDNTVFGIAGHLGAGLKFVAWLQRNNYRRWETEEPCPLDDETTVLEVNLSTEQAWLWEHPGWPIVVAAPIAVGSGAAAALGAMYAGASACEAVDIASKIDEGTSGGVLSYSGIIPYV